MNVHKLWRQPPSDSEVQVLTSTKDSVNIQVKVSPGYINSLTINMHLRLRLLGNEFIKFFYYQYHLRYASPLWKYEVL
jgi:hypothetical protein